MTTRISPASVANDEVAGSAGLGVSVGAGGGAGACESARAVAKATITTSAYREEAGVPVRARLRLQPYLTLLSGDRAAGEGVLVLREDLLNLAGNTSLTTRVMSYS